MTRNQDFKQWYLQQGKSLLYFIFSICLTIFPFLLSTLVFPINLLIGLFSLALAYRYFVLSAKIAGSIFRLENTESSVNKKSRIVNLQSGTYNESLHVQGDYIAGNQYVNNIFRDLNFDQNVIQLLENIQKTVNDLINKTGDTSSSKQKAIEDLIEVVRTNRQLKSQFNLYLESNGLLSSNSEREIAESILGVVRLEVREPFWKKYINTERKKEQYSRLEYLLQTAQWREADEETVKLLKQLMSHRIRTHGCTDISIAQVTPKELKAINQMWLEASGGRFGFSVQQRIWKKIQNLQSNPNTDFYDQESYDLFVEMVGWSNDMGRIYHSDFTYQITDAPGCLPARILLLETYNPNSKYCTFSACLFDELMARNYSEGSFLPSWLRKWLLLE